MTTANKGLTRIHYLLAGAAILLSAVYLVNCFSPLRLHVDSLRYFAIKDCVESGCPPDSEAAKDYLPWGYTVLLLMLSKTGILHSFTLILANCIFLGGALWFLQKMFRSAFHPFAFICAVLLSWVMIKFVTHPLSEMQYLFFSVLSLYFFYRYAQDRKIFHVFLSFLFAGIAFLTRSVGVALVTALVIGLFWIYRKELINFARRNKIVVAITVLLVLVSLLFARQLGLTHYTGVFNKQFDEGVGMKDVLAWHFREWTELFLNTSKARLAGMISAGTTDQLFMVTGVLIVAFFIFLLFRSRNEIPAILKIYFIVYSLLMFNWPFYDPRFWVPVVPVMVMVVMKSGFLYKNRWRIISYPFLAIYIILGIMSVGYMTYTSLDKEAFARKQANGVYRNEYETVFFGKPLSDTATKTDPVIISVLKRYN